MKLLKRAVTNIGSNKGKALLLVVIFFTAMFTITINSILSETHAKLLEEAFPEGEVPVNVEIPLPETIFGHMVYNWEDLDKITDEMNEEIAKSELLSRSILSVVSSVDIPFEQVEGAYYNTLGILYDDDPKMLTEIKGYEYNYDQNLYLTAESPIVLNEDFLKINNFAVGDTIQIDFSNDIYNEEWELIEIDELKEIEYTIVGTYHFEPTQEMIDQETKWALENDTEPNLRFGSEKVMAFMPMKNAEDLINIAKANGVDSSYIVDKSYLIYLKELSNLSAFKEEVKNITGFDVDVEVYLYAADDGTGFMGLEQIIMMRNHINRVFPVILVVALAILAITEILLIHGRRMDIRKQLEHGESRMNIYFQIVLERILIMISVTLAVFPIATLIIQKFGGLGSEALFPFVISPLFISMLTGLIIVFVSTLIPAIYTMLIKFDKIK